LDAVGGVIFTTGFRPDYARWVQLPAFDAWGFPLAVDGASTVVPGLHFASVHFLRTRKSSLLFGVGDDATLVARGVAARRRP
jgi:putative flavoprotein involved in K+ transport